MPSIKLLSESKREALYLFLYLSGIPNALTSLLKSGVTSITVLGAIESFLLDFTSKEYNTGSKLEFTTASFTGRESAATTSWLTTLRCTLSPFFSHLMTWVFIFPPPNPIPAAVFEILLTMSISLPNRLSGIS